VLLPPKAEKDNKQVTKPVAEESKSLSSQLEQFQQM
jgi:hypothetical protein